MVQVGLMGKSTRGLKSPRVKGLLVGAKASLDDFEELDQCLAAFLGST